MIIATSNPSLSTQLAAAIPLAFLACLYPPAVAVVILYLGLESPRRLVLAYLAGALAMTALAATVGILLLQGSNVTPKHHPAPSAGLQILLGVAMLVAAVMLARRKRVQKEPKKTHEHDPRGAFLLGVVMYVPSLFYLSAIKQVADANAGFVPTLLSGLLLALIVPLLVEIPVGLYLLFPDWTSVHLKAFNEWMRRHGRTIVLVGLIVGGLYLLGTGIDRAVTG
ncbi:MAG TPA: GAP family protein [Acidimicrobiales bacterium]|nr:GAP family protein [Acidimicrobiales bacterium]